mgnify:CR=1 FL=1
MTPKERNTWFSRSAGSNNEVQAREGIYKSRAGKPTAFNRWEYVENLKRFLGTRMGGKNSRDTCNIDFDMSDFYNRF